MDNNQIQQNVIENDKANDIILRLDKITQQEDKTPMNMQKQSEILQLALLIYPQNTKKTGVTHSQKTWVRSLQTQFLLLLPL